MDHEHDIDDEAAGIVDLDRGEPKNCARIASTLDADGAQIQRAVGPLGHAHVYGHSRGAVPPRS